MRMATRFTPCRLVIFRGVGFRFMIVDVCVEGVKDGAWFVWGGLGFNVIGFGFGYPTGAALLAGCGSYNVEQPCTSVQFLVVESSVNVGDVNVGE